MLPGRSSPNCRIVSRMAYFGSKKSSFTLATCRPTRMVISKTKCWLTDSCCHQHSRARINSYSWRSCRYRGRRLSTSANILSRILIVRSSKGGESAGVKNREGLISGRWLGMRQNGMGWQRYWMAWGVSIVEEKHQHGGRSNTMSHGQ